MTNVLSMIESQIRADSIERDRMYKRNGHWFSDLTRCNRSRYYSWKNEPVTNHPNISGQFKMDIGNHIESWFRDKLLRCDDTFVGSSNKKIQLNIGELEYPFRFELDIPAIIQGSKMVIEIKSSHGRGITDIKKSGKPKLDHALQTFGYVNYEGYDKGKIIYIARDSGYTTSFDLIRGTRYWFELESAFNIQIERTRELEKSLRDCIIPDREYKLCFRDGVAVDKFTADRVDYKSDFQCNYCNYKEKCWEEMLGEKLGKYCGTKRIV